MPRTYVCIWGGFFFLEGDVGGEHESAHAEAEGIPESDEAAQHGQFHDGVAVEGAVEGLFVHDDGAVGSAHGYGHVPLPAHHDAFNDCLPAVVEFSQGFSFLMVVMGIVPDLG